LTGPANAQGDSTTVRCWAVGSLPVSFAKREGGEAYAHVHHALNLVQQPKFRMHAILACHPGWHVQEA